MIKLLLILSLSLFATSAFATKGDPCSNSKLGPACLQICNACKGAGFIVGEAKIGDGFWVDCIAPLVTGNAEPQKAVKAGHPLPAAPSGGWGPIASQCQGTNAGWGMPKAKASH